MNLPGPPMRHRGEQVAPLIDVVFLLLIFFMLVGVIAPPEPFNVEPPTAEWSAATERDSIIILLGSDGQLAFEGETLDLPMLAVRVGGRLAPKDVRADETAADVRVELKADAAVDSGQVLAVVEVLRAAGIEQLSLMTVQQVRQ